MLKPIRQVAVIGAGAGGAVAGAALAARCVQAGFRTVLEDILPGNLRRAAAEIDPRFSPRYATGIEDAVRDADLVIDTVPDELESKLEILSLLDRMAPPHTLFATPTEALSIRDLASCTYRPGQCFGLRFRWGQGGLMQISIGYALPGSQAALVQVEDFFRALGAVVESRADTRALP